MKAASESPCPEQTALRAPVSLIRRLARLHRRESITALALSLLAAATEGIGILVLIPLLSLLGVAAGAATSQWASIPLLSAVTGNLYVVLAFFLVLLTLRQVIVYFQQIRVMRTRLNFSTELRLELLEALANAKWERFSAGTLHRQTQILTLDSHRAGDAAQQCFGLAAATFVTAVQIIVAIWLSPTFTFIVLAATAAIVALLSGRLRRVNTLGRQLTERNNAIYELTMNFVPMLRTARMSGTTSNLLSRFRTENERMNDTVTNYVAHHTASTASIQLAAGVTLSVCLVVWINIFALGAMQISILVLIFARLTPVLGQIHRLVQNLAHDLPAVENALANIEDWRAHAELDAEIVETPVTSPSQSIGLQAVSGGYAASHPAHVLQDVSFTMPVGGVTLLSGPTGAGKSTVADVLSGLLQPATGAIVIDNQPLTRQQLRNWRRKIGYVDQDATLLTGTIEDNLTWGTNNVDRDWIEEVLWLATISDFLDDLPAGLASPAGERGAQLSGGQRQRIAIARELIRRPELLILDEATSGLDRTAEARLFQRLKSIGAPLTILLISHRGSSLEFADTTVKLEGGRVTSVAATDGSRTSSVDPGKRVDRMALGAPG